MCKELADVLISLARVMLFRVVTKYELNDVRDHVLISLARVMLFRVKLMQVLQDQQFRLNLSCESNAFQGVPLWNPHK